MQVRRADDGDADAIALLVADAYGHYIERIGRRPKPMTADQYAAVRDHEVWVARDVVDDSLVGVLRGPFRGREAPGVPWEPVSRGQYR